MGRVLLCVATLLLAAARAQADRPALRIGTIQYDLKDVYGASMEDLVREFDAEVKALPLDQLKRAVWYYLRMANEFPKLQKETDRGVLTRALRQAYFQNLLEQAAIRLLAIHVTDHVLALHGTDPGDYCDIRALKDALVRTVKYFDYMIAHGDDPPAKDEELYRVAKKAFRLKDATQGAWWKFNRELWRSEPKKLAMRGVERSRYLATSDNGYKAYVAPYLFYEACQKGVYYDLGRDYFDFYGSTILEMHFTNFAGGKPKLEAFFAQVIGKDGDVTEAGVHKLQRWLKEFSPATKLQLASGLGIVWLTGYAHPRAGRVYEVGPNSYKIYAQRRTRPRTGAGDITSQAFARKIVAARFVPDVQCYVKGVKLDAEELLARALGIGKMETYFNGVEPGKIEKKPYPNRFFQEYEAHRPALDDAVLTAARLHVQGDKQEARRFVAEMRQAAGKAETPGVRRAYTGIADKLEKSLKLEAK